MGACSWRQDGRSSTSAALKASIIAPVGISGSGVEGVRVHEMVKLCLVEGIVWVAAVIDEAIG